MQDIRQKAAIPTGERDKNTPDSIFAADCVLCSHHLTACQTCGFLLFPTLCECRQGVGGYICMIRTGSLADVRRWAEALKLVKTGPLRRFYSLRWELDSAVKFYLKPLSLQCVYMLHWAKGKILLCEKSTEQKVSPINSICRFILHVDIYPKLNWPRYPCKTDSHSQALLRQTDSHHHSSYIAL